MQIPSAPEKCPRDGTQLFPLTFSGQTVMTCHHCGGIWFSPVAFSHVVTSSLDMNALNSLTQRDTPNVPPPLGPEMCPDGHGPMRRFNYAGSRDILIDRCDSCGGIWIDDSECRQIAERRRSLGEDYGNAYQPDPFYNQPQFYGSQYSTLNYMNQPTSGGFLGFVTDMLWWLL